MKFDSKTKLMEHIKELERNGYLIEHKIYSDDGKNTYIETMWKINFGAVKP